MVQQCDRHDFSVILRIPGFNLVPHLGTENISSLGDLNRSPNTVDGKNPAARVADR